MRVASWDRYGLSYARVVLLASGLAAMTAALVIAATLRTMGSISLVLAALTGLAGAYLVMSEPSRSLERAALRQALDAPTLAASVSVHLRTTGSRNRTILALESEDGELAAALRDARRLTLLGTHPRETLEALGSRVASHSVKRVLDYLANYTGESVEDEGEEFEDAFRSSLSSEETKAPVFIAAAFFTPIMLVIFCSITHNTAPVTVVSLVFLEAILLNILFSLSSAESGRVAA